MKTTLHSKTVAIALLLTGSAAILSAQTSGTSCPLGFEPGYGRTLDAAQRAEHRDAVRQWVAELKQKQQNGTLTAGEQAWLDRFQELGGTGCWSNASGAAGGRGSGAGPGAGQRRRLGARDGTGPRCTEVVCPGGAQNRQRGGR